MIKHFEKVDSSGKPVKILKPTTNPNKSDTTLAAQVFRFPPMPVFPLPPEKPTLQPLHADAWCFHSIANIAS